MKKSAVLSVLFFSLIQGLMLAKTIHGIEIEFVTIGNPFNVADTQLMRDGTTSYGSVGYEYLIGKYEITNNQWNTFTTKVGTPFGNPSNAYARNSLYTESFQPANNISWYEAVQFCNYLTSGDKSKGVYQFSGNNANPGDFISIDRNSAKVTYGIIYFLPTEDEWYKAAYYKPDGTGYSLYANGSNTISPADNGWNYSGGTHAIPWNVGAGVQEQNGTYDMMGNVWEWNETLVIGTTRSIRGGAYYGYGSSDLISSYRNYSKPENDGGAMGFRIASIVPEPCTLLLLGMGGMLIRKNSKKNCIS